MVRAIIFDFFGVIRSEGLLANRDMRVLDYAKELRQKYKVGLFSNMSKGGLATYFVPGELGKYFDFAATSGDIGHAKPEPEAYLVVAKQLGAEPADCVMIDDRWEWCAAAELLGMRSITFSSFEQCKAELEELLKK